MPRTALFETYVARYEAWFETHRCAYESELEAVRSLLPKSGHGIEVGVGTGRFAAPLGVAAGVEPSPAMGARARQRGVAVVEGIAEALPFEEAAFDYVLMVTTVCFLDDVTTAFEEAYRVLKPGGVFVVGLLDRDSPPGRRYAQRKTESVFYREAHLHSASEVAALMKQAGFQGLTARQTIFSDPRRMRQPDPVKSGYGEGVFVVWRGVKR